MTLPQRRRGPRSRAGVGVPPLAGESRVIKPSPSDGSLGAVVFASVFAAPAPAALGRGSLQPRKQFGDRLTNGLWLGGIQVRIGAAMASVGRRRR